MSISVAMQINQTFAADGPEASEFAAGFARVEAQVRAVPERQLRGINVNIPRAVTTVLGAWPELKALRSSFADLPGFDLANFDSLRDYALALGHTHAALHVATGASGGLSKLADDLAEVRDILHADAAALIRRKILDEAGFTNLHRGNGYKDMAFEVVGLVGLLRQGWEAINGRSALELEELEHAARLAQDLVTAVGMQERVPAAVRAAAALRLRAYTLLMAAYDDVRRAVSYLRRPHRDADVIAPSLFAGHGPRTRPTPEKPNHRAQAARASEPDVLSCSGAE